MTAHQPRYGMRYLTETQRKVYDLLVEAYRADVAVEIATKTKRDFEHDLATASRTVVRGLVTHGLADYSPAGGFVLLSEHGKREAGLPARATSGLADILS